MKTSRIGARIIDVALDPRQSDVLIRLAPAQARVGEPRVSLLRYPVHSRYMDNICGAVERATPQSLLEKLHIAVGTRPIQVGNATFFAVTLLASPPLLRLRARILRAITPGLTLGESQLFEAPWPPASPVFVPEFATVEIPPFSLDIASISVYELAGSTNDVTKLLWRMAA